jgi:hypothetical protein
MHWKKDRETFVSEEPDYVHIFGAYLKENYREKNILQSLLSFSTDALNEKVCSLD